MRKFLLLVMVGVLSIGLGVAHAYVPAFKARMDFGAGMSPYSVAVGDLNGDGNPDLAVANVGAFPANLDGSVSVLLGNGDGTFQPAVNYGAGWGPIL